MELETEIFKITCELYNNLKFANTDVQYVISLLRNFIINSYNPFLLKELDSNVLEAVDIEIKNDINLIFKKYKDPFEKFSTHKKRMVLYKNMGVYVEPEISAIKEIPIAVVRQNKITLKSKQAQTVHMSIKHSFTKLLEMDGLFDGTMSYLNSLKSDERGLFNFVQGSLWKNQVENFHEDGIALPLIVYFDDVETGNALGTHAGNNSVGCVYATIPCFPPNFASKLHSIVLTDIFYTKDKANYGNEVVFKKLINELQDLRKNGMLIVVNKKLYKIHLLTCLIVGDNKGLNDIEGFVRSFTLSHCCRICNAGPTEWKKLKEEDEVLLRSKENHETDMQIRDISKTGVREQCIFNELEGFNVIENGSVDVMHDVFEGVANYDVSKILLHLINEKYFSIDFINDVLNTMDFGFEKTNLPPNIKFDFLKSNNWLKMSASEMLFFTRYLGLIVGELVPQESEIWELYIKLREIISIITSPAITAEDLIQLDILISEHHNIYIKYFGQLKFKFHSVIHYKRMILQNGPLIKISSMRFESKHREIKAIIQATSSRRNILKTVGIRHQLCLMQYKYAQYKNLNINYGPAINDDSINIHFQDSLVRQTLSNIIINDIKYKAETIIVATIGENCPGFGEIDKIYLVDNEIYFRYIPFYVIGFNTHYFAYSVVADMEKKLIISYDSISVKTPCTIYKKKRNHIHRYKTSIVNNNILL